eukprot:TRINITY_DN11473_c0_g1_i5.p1 TRINITY_DN11473_c0_g1~~TRINITY_DN11473_c0_g1_i5.p1  ORF type:complete len:190 (+),score=56.77 TRINITY_DN11473_c0_g1_i5:85-654(+)
MCIRDRHTILRMSVPLPLVRLVEVPSASNKALILASGAVLAGAITGFICLLLNSDADEEHDNTKTPGAVLLPSTLEAALKQLSELQDELDQSTKTNMLTLLEVESCEQLTTEHKKEMQGEAWAEKMYTYMEHVIKKRYEAERLAVCARRGVSCPKELFLGCAPHQKDHPELARLLAKVQVWEAECDVPC